MSREFGPRGEKYYFNNDNNAGTSSVDQKQVRKPTPEEKLKQRLTPVESIEQLLELLEITYTPYDPAHYFELREAVISAELGNEPDQEVLKTQLGNILYTQLAQLQKMVEAGITYNSYLNKKTAIVMPLNDLLPEVFLYLFGLGSKEGATNVGLKGLMGQMGMALTNLKGFKIGMTSPGFQDFNRFKEFRKQLVAISAVNSIFILPTVPGNISQAERNKFNKDSRQHTDVPEAHMGYSTKQDGAILTTDPQQQSSEDFLAFFNRVKNGLHVDAAIYHEDWNTFTQVDTGIVALAQLLSTRQIGWLLEAEQVKNRPEIVDVLNQVITAQNNYRIAKLQPRVKYK